MVRAGGSISVAAKYQYEKQPIASLTQSPVVQNTWYTILDTIEDVRILTIMVRQKNDDTNAKNIEVRATIDGIVTDCAIVNAIHNTWYYIYQDPDSEDLRSHTLIINAAYYTDWRGQSFKLEMRTTSVIGTNQTLDGRCQHEQLNVT